MGAGRRRLNNNSWYRIPIFFINCLHLRNTYFLTGDMLKLSTRALLYGGMNILQKVAQGTVRSKSAFVRATV